MICSRFLIHVTIWWCRLWFGLVWPVQSNPVWHFMCEFNMILHISASNLREKPSLHSIKAEALSKNRRMCSPRTRHVHSPDTTLLFLTLGQVFLRVFRLSQHYHSTNTPYPVVHHQLTLLPTLNNCRNWHCQCCHSHCHPNKGCFPLSCLQHLWKSLHS